MHMSLAGTNLSNEQPETGRVIALSGHAARRCRRQACLYQVHGPNAFEKRKGALHEPDPGAPASRRPVLPLHLEAATRRQDAGSTLRFMESPIRFLRMHRDHEL